MDCDIPITFEKMKSGTASILYTSTYIYIYSYYIINVNVNLFVALSREYYLTDPHAYILGGIISNIGYFWLKTREDAGES